LMIRGRNSAQSYEAQGASGEGAQLVRAPA
jgi:hypothetical protein